MTPGQASGLVHGPLADWARSRGEALAIEGFETRVWAAPHPDDPARIKGAPIPQEVMDRFA